MSDNTTLNSGSGGDTISTDDLGGGVKVQRVKVQYGADGSATDVASGTPLPVTIAGSTATVTVDASGATQPVSSSTYAGFFARIEGRLDNDSAISSTVGQPVVVGGEYSSSPPKVSASGDAVRLRLTQDGKILDMYSAPASDTTNVNSNYAAAQTNTSIVSAPGSNKRLVVVEIAFSTDTAGTMKLVEDPAGTPATKFGPHYLTANGGIALHRCYWPLSTNKALGITTTIAGNHTISLRAIVENV